MKKVTIYTKWCLSCTYPEELKYIRLWVGESGIKVRRTTYRPDWHHKATRLYGNEHYDAFVVVNKKEVEDLMSFAENCKNKLVKEGVIKNDMCELQRTADDHREASEAVADNQSSAEDEIHLAAHSRDRVKEA